MLAHKIFGSVERVRSLQHYRTGKSRFGLVAKLTERSLRWTEGEVCSRGRHCVKAIRLNVLKSIVAIRVCNRLAVLHPVEINHRTRDRSTGAGSDLSGDN